MPKFLVTINKTSSSRISIEAESIPAAESGAKAGQGTVIQQNTNETTQTQLDSTPEKTGPISIIKTPAAPETAVAPSA